MNERFIGPAFIVAIASSLGLCVVFVAGGNAQLEGLFLFGAFGGIGVGLVLWAKHLFPQDEVVQERHTIESTPEEQEEFASLIESEGQDVTRRRFLSGLGIGALGTLGIAAIFPLRSLGPGDTNYLFSTGWEKGDRLVTDDGRPIRPTDLNIDAIVPVWPEGKEKNERDSTLLIKVPSDQYEPRKGRETWAPEFNVAYSKICTHVGCPVSLYRTKTYELLCPCHQSTFDVLDGARPAFGPASRSLPQLPLMVNDEGYLAAQSDYQEPIGGGFWNRDRRPELTGKDEA
jgi:ubiquinol-cytochrome c reductase iron-sulfur subunit